MHGGGGGGVLPSLIILTSYYNASLLSRVYSDNATGDSSFGVSAGDCKDGMGPSTTHLTYYKYDYWLDGGGFVILYQVLSRNYSFQKRQVLFFFIYQAV